MARWHGWGAAPHVFDRPEWESTRAELRALIGDDGLKAAARTALNAHYTDPRIVAAMWKAVDDLGVTGGVVIEPGCGSGEILAAAPDGFRGLGVELDPTTAAVAQARLGSAHTVVAGDFSKLDVAGGAAAMVGNVPFGSFQLYDPVHNPDRELSIHDHFIAKGAASLAPGGVAVVITSRYTLDSQSAAGRRAIGQHADFLGAVRLPSVAHQAHAGTQVVTDILVLRGRAPGVEPAHAYGWTEGPAAVTGEAGESTMNRYFTRYPKQVLGDVDVRTGQFGPELAVTWNGDPDGWAGELARPLASITGWVEAGPSRPSPVTDPVVLLATEATDRVPVGRIERTATGVFRVRTSTGWESHSPGRHGGELAVLLELRDGAAALVDAEGDPQVPDSIVEELRSRLAGQYRSYVDRFGAVNRFTITASGQRRTPSLGGFRKDPGFARVCALEIYDGDADRAIPAALLEHRVVRPAEPITSAATADDAMAIALQQRGRFDPEYVASLLSIDVDDLEPALGDLVFRDPATEALVPRSEYLSGNVRAKLRAAQAAADEDPTYRRHVDELSAVMPRDVTADDLTGMLGAPWIPRETIHHFAVDIAGARPEEITVQFSEVMGRWSIKGSEGVTHRLRSGNAFSTEKLHALDLLEDGLNGVSPVVYRTVEERRVIDPDATELARERLSELADHFDSWALHHDDDRSAELLRLYNERFNSHVSRSFAGMTVAAPGMRDDFELRPHQHQAISRVLHGGNTLLAHPVGAGKTAEMIVAGMELKRLGLANRPGFVVPNHMLDQFSRDIYDLYPAAEVLVISPDDVSPKGRAAFAARASSHDWDAVVITHSSFARWPLSAEVVEDLQQRRLAEIDADLAAVEAQGSGRTLTKALEKRRVNAEEKLAKAKATLEARRDDHDLPFDKAGIDYLFVDEAQAYKNGEISSSVRDLRGVPVGDGSQQAADYRDKVTWLRESRPGRSTLTEATATPIANTMAEMWVHGRYLRPDLLNAMGMGRFDPFRLQFCDTVSAMELDPSGTKFRQVERLARYKNLPELSRWWGEFVDVVRPEDLNLPKPEQVGGGRKIVTVEPAPGLAEFMAVDVSKRADAIRNRQVTPEEDNMLKLSSDCRNASFDWEAFSGEHVPDEYSTFAACADDVAAVWERDRDKTYRMADGTPHPRPGSFQLVFADLGTPKKGEPSSYERLKAMLVARGIPAEQIQFAHDHDANAGAKDRFFASCRDGRVAVAIASTAKMGVGTNVQTRLAWGYHLDCPWRPDFIEQREGRWLRQGNQNTEVGTTAYATEKSFSVYGWQTLERKAGFIGQIMRATPDGPRSIEVTDDEALSYGEVKALATGDPDFLTAAKLEDELARVDRLSRAHARDVTAASRRADTYDRELRVLDHELEVLGPIADRASHLDPERPWALRIDGEIHTNRADAARAAEEKIGYRHTPVTIGRFEEENIELRFDPEGARAGRWQLVDGDTGALLPRRLAVGVDDRFDLSASVGALQKVGNRVHGLDAARGSMLDRREVVVERLATSRTAASAVFPHRDRLQTARKDVEAIRARLAEKYGDDGATSSAPAAVAPTSPASGARGRTKRPWPRPGDPAGPAPSTGPKL
jgi:N12 class adenine-specific DNA methylase